MRWQNRDKKLKSDKFLYHPEWNVGIFVGNFSPNLVQPLENRWKYQMWWRRRWDSNPRWALTHVGFQDRCIRPLCHSSDPTAVNELRAILKDEESK